MITEITRYIGLQSTPQDGQAPALFPDNTFCCLQQRQDLNQQIISIFLGQNFSIHNLKKNNPTTKKIQQQNKSQQHQMMVSLSLRNKLLGPSPTEDICSMLRSLKGKLVLGNRYCENRTKNKAITETHCFPTPKIHSVNGFFTQRFYIWIMVQRKSARML